MSDENVVKESTGSMARKWRVRLVQDSTPPEPYDDGSVPLWRVDYAGLGWTAEQVKMTDFDASAAGLSDAVNRFGGPTSPLVERWLKAYRGTTVMEVYHSGSAWYIAADTAAWREETGVTVEQLAEESALTSIMSEYKSWIEGDVYGYVIERCVIAYTVVHEPADGEIIGSRREEEWIEVEDGSLWGIYSHSWALKQAEEDFDAYLRDLDKRENAHLYETVYLKES